MKHTSMTKSEKKKLLEQGLYYSHEVRAKLKKGNILYCQDSMRNMLLIERLKQFEGVVHF